MHSRIQGATTPPPTPKGPRFPYYCPQTKLRKGNVFTSVCQEFCPQGSVHAPGRHPTGQTLPGRHPPGRRIPGQTHPLSRHPPPPSDGYYSRQYASYWNAFLFLNFVSRQRQHIEKVIERRLRNVHILQSIILNENTSGTRPGHLVKTMQ